MSGLSAEDRAALEAAGWHDLYPAVEQIVQRHIEAFKAEAVAAMERESGCTCEACETYNHAARIVRNVPT